VAVEVVGVESAGATGVEQVAFARFSEDALGCGADGDQVGGGR
jgi:hypothetical protein